MLPCNNGGSQMTTFDKIVEIPEDRHLVLELPADTPTGEVNISVTITPIQPKQTTRTLESFCGIFKDDPFVIGDPVEIQRKMRDEW
jgi:hypothetical protein